MRGVKKAGFTIVELLIVIVVIGILAAITIIAYNGITGKARVATMQSDLANAASALELAKVNSGTEQYPVDGSSLSASSGNVLNYQPDNSSNLRNYCLTVASNGITYKITNTNTAVTPGSCSGVLPSGASCPTGFIVVPGNSTFSTSDFCVMKYEAKQASATVPISQASGTPWVNITRANAITYSANVAGCTGCHLISENEWMTIAANVLGVASNWSGGTVGSGYIYSGHNDNSPANALAASTDDNDGYNGTGNVSGNQDRTLTLSNGEVIWDLAGNVWEHVNATIAGNAQPGLASDASYVFKEWNNGSMLWRSFPTTSRPSAISGGSGWSSSNGIGQLYSNYAETTGTNIYIRSGSWSNGVSSGVLTLGFNAVLSAANLGFRVAK